MKKVLTFLCLFLIFFTLFSCENEEGESYYNEDSYVFRSSRIVEQTLFFSIEPIITTTTEVITETTIIDTIEASTESVEKEIIYISPTGKKYHKSKKCAGKNATEIEIDIAIERGKTACKKCVK